MDLTLTDDETLIRRIHAGDQRAFAELFRRHREDVLRLVFRMAGRGSDLEDLVQEVFLQVYRSLPGFKGQSRLSTWIYRIAVNVVLMYRRSQKSRPILTSDEGLSPARDHRELPDELVAQRERIAAFERLLDQLSEKKRTVFILHELEGIPPTEIATILGTPALTVRTRLFYARKELTAAFANEPSLAALLDEFEPHSRPVASLDELDETVRPLSEVPSAPKGDPS